MKVISQKELDKEFEFLENNRNSEAKSNYSQWIFQSNT
mgnify:CR=1 FL=1